MKVKTIDIESTFRRLVVDISCLASVPLALPDSDNFDIMKWGLIEGPLLDKALLYDIENTTTTAQKLCPLWLKPLYAAFISESFGAEHKDKALMLRYLRQACLFIYKAKLPYDECTEERTREAFIATDSSLDNTWRYRDWSHPTGAEELVLRRARRLCQRIIFDIDWTSINPQHGPGSVYPSRTAMRKGQWMFYYHPIARIYPYAEYFFLPKEGFEHENIAKLQDRCTIQAKLVCVPKDARGPRLICVHPAEAVWIQQGQRKLLESVIERRIPTICFTDQSINQRAAHRSSLTKENVTLDLSEASDRISTHLVEYLFGEYAYEFMASTRAQEVILPGGRVHRLRKFAPMGNCLTFPVQTLVFWSLIMAAMQHHRIKGECCVFGDDCIFPTEAYDPVQQIFGCVGLKINVNKTFSKGLFRESCGLDSYRGVLVSPLRLKEVDTSYLGLIALCDLAKRLRLSGYEATAAHLYDEVRKYSTVSVHSTNDPYCSGLIEYKTYSNIGECLCQRTVRFNDNTHQYEIRSHKVVPTVMEGTIDDASHLLESVVRPSQGPNGLAARYVDVHNASLARTWSRVILSDNVRGCAIPSWYHSSLVGGREAAFFLANDIHWV